MLIKMCARCKTLIQSHNRYCDKCKAIVEKQIEDNKQRNNTRYNKQRDKKSKVKIIMLSLVKR